MTEEQLQVAHDPAATLFTLPTEDPTKTSGLRKPDVAVAADMSSGPTCLYLSDLTWVIIQLINTNTSHFFDTVDDRRRPGPYPHCAKYWSSAPDWLLLFGKPPQW